MGQTPVNKLTQLEIVAEAKAVNKPVSGHSEGVVGAAEDVDEVSSSFKHH